MKVKIEKIGGEDEIKEVTKNTLKKTIQEAWESNWVSTVKIYKKVFGSYMEVAYISMIHPLEIHLNGYQTTEWELRTYTKFMIENSKPGNMAFDITWKENQ